MQHWYCNRLQIYVLLHRCFWWNSIKRMMETRHKHCHFVEEWPTVTQVTEIMGGTCSMFWTIYWPKIQLSLMDHFVIWWGKYLEPRWTKEMYNLDYRAVNFLIHRSHPVLLWNQWGYHVLHVWHGWGEKKFTEGLGAKLCTNYPHTTNVFQTPSSTTIKKQQLQ